MDALPVEWPEGAAAARAMTSLPTSPRYRLLADRPPRPAGDFVLYWMTAARRLGWNFALERAVALAAEHRRPLVVLEALRCDYPWASDRLHRFVIDGMADNERRAARLPVLYYPYLEPAPGAGRGLLVALSARAVAIVTDDFPGFFLPRMLAAAAARVESRLESVDSNGLLPVRAAAANFPSAYAFRRYLQSSLGRHLLEAPRPDPCSGPDLPRLGGLPPELERRWPRATPRQLAGDPAELARFPIDHGVPPVDGVRGGAAAARRALDEFLEHRLARYATERNQPGDEVASGLSPHLHFGHLASHEILARLADREGWDPAELPAKGNGGRAGWWGMSAASEAFLDQLVTWRELGHNACATRPDDYERYESLPAWARATLERHETDPRRWVYALEALERAETHDPLWNAAQRQLVGAGRIHNYLRMLWGKKILEWSATPRAALAAMIELNNRYALDGRDPNSYSGILWCLGRYDRPWAPERAVFGVVRYMSSENTARKLDLGPYLERWGTPAAAAAAPRLAAPDAER